MQMIFNLNDVTVWLGGANSTNNIHFHGMVLYRNDIYTWKASPYSHGYRINIINPWNDSCHFACDETTTFNLGLEIAFAVKQ